MDLRSLQKPIEREVTAVTKWPRQSQPGEGGQKDVLVDAPVDIGRAPKKNLYMPKPTRSRRRRYRLLVPVTFCGGAGGLCANHG